MSQTDARYKPTPKAKKYQLAPHTLNQIAIIGQKQELAMQLGQRHRQTGTGTGTGTERGNGNRVSRVVQSFYSQWFSVLHRPLGQDLKVVALRFISFIQNSSFCFPFSPFFLLW